mmetsp:Transcript_95363/g.132466  ORF Transcript_95363/g.132466 Transcript_95363/m.132466 type:complete len:288 (+) Transcript_95363:168-1031(+)
MLSQQIGSVGVRQVCAALLHSLHHGTLAFTDPFARVVEALVWLVLTLRVADLPLEVTFLRLVELEKALPVGPLRVGVHVHLHNSRVQCGGDVMLLRSGAPMEDKVQRPLNVLSCRGFDLLTCVDLHVLQQLGLQHNVSGLVNAVDVAESRSDGEHRGDGIEGLVDREHIRRRGVQLLLGGSAVVNAIFHSTSDSNLHLQDLLHGGHAGQVLCADGNVLLIGLLGQVQHVRREEGLAMLLEECLVGFEHAIEPRQQLLGAVVGVHDHRDAVSRSNCTDKVSSGNSSQD